MRLRLLTLLAFCLLLVRLAVVATRPEVEPESPGTVTVEMSVWGMPWENDLYTRVYIPEFERRNPGIKVRFQHFEDYANRILLSHAGGIAPDVIRMNIDFSMGWIRKGVNLPLDRFIDGPDGIDRADFIPATWEGLKWNGRTWGVPQDINMWGLFYNKDLFDKAGIPYPDASWTWDDLYRASRRLTTDADGDGHPEVLGLNMGWNWWALRAFAYQTGARFWNDDKTAACADTPEVVEALRFMKTLMQRYTLTQSSSTRGGLGPDKLFEQGRVAMFYDGSWRTPSLVSNAPKLRFGVAPLPRGKQAATPSTSCYWAISSQCRHPEAAWKLVKFLSSTEALEQYWQTLWVAPPARWSALRSERFRHIAGMPGKVPGLPDAEWEEKCRWIRDCLENGWTKVEENGPYSDILRSHLGKAVDRVMLENADPAAELRAGVAAANRQIGDVRSGGKR